MILNRQKLIDILEDQDISALDDDAELEDVIALMKDYDNKISFLKKLKQNRTKVITEEMNKLEERKDSLKAVIQSTLEKFEHKSLNFPGVGKVAIRKASDKWEVRDEEGLIAHLEDTLDDSEKENVFKESKTIVKKELNEFLKQWEKEGKVPDSVQKIIGEQSVSVQFDKDVSNKVNEIEEARENRDTLSDSPQYDGIDF